MKLETYQKTHLFNLIHKRKPKKRNKHMPSWFLEQVFISDLEGRKIQEVPFEVRKWYSQYYWRTRMMTRGHHSMYTRWQRHIRLAYGRWEYDA